MRHIHATYAPALVFSLAAATLGACGSSSGGGGGGGGGGTEPLSPEAQAAYDAQRPSAERAALASSDFEGIVKSGDPDPVGTLQSMLRARPEISDVRYLDVSGTVLGRVAGSVPFNVFVADKSRKEWVPEPTTTEALLPNRVRPLQASPSIQCDPTTFPQSKTACIVSGFASAFKQDLGPVRASLQRAGFTVTDFALKTPEDLKTLHDALGTCGVLYISSHGAVAQNVNGDAGNHVVTEIEFSQSNVGRMVGAVGPSLSNVVGIGGLPPPSTDPKSYYSLAPEFFASATYPNTLVYVDTCSSAQPASGAAQAGGTTTQLRDAFRKNGAGAFIGWEAPVSVSLSNPVTDQIFDGLAPKASNIASVKLVITPPMPGAGQPYVPSASISPAQSGVELHLTVSGTDGFSRDERMTTDAGGNVTFSSVPGGQGGVVDTITLSAGGASNSATAVEVVKNNPTLPKYKLAWLKGDTGAAQLSLDANANFNLVCANQALTQTQSVVKF